MNGTHQCDFLNFCGTFGPQPSSSWLGGEAVQEKIRSPKSGHFKKEPGDDSADGLLMLPGGRDRQAASAAHRQHHYRIPSPCSGPLLPRRVCCARRGAMPGQHARGSEQAQETTSPKKNKCDKQVSSWRHTSCHTDKNRYYT